MAVLIRSPSGLHAASKLIREACACGAQLQASGPITCKFSALTAPHTRREGSEEAVYGVGRLIGLAGVPGL